MSETPSNPPTVPDDSVLEREGQRGVHKRLKRYG
jgi:hypothetical protein